MAGAVASLRNRRIFGLFPKPAMVEEDGVVPAGVFLYVSLCFPSRSVSILFTVLGFRTVYTRYNFGSMMEIGILSKRSLSMMAVALVLLDRLFNSSGENWSFF